MFVRKKKNRSGTVSVVVVDKSRGRFKELATIGVGREEDELRMLERKAHEWISVTEDSRSCPLKRVKRLWP